MKIRLLSLILIVASSWISAQSKADSLKVALQNAKDDSAKCRIIYALISLEESEETGLKYTQDLIDLSKLLLSRSSSSAEEKKTYTNYIIDGYNLLGHLNGDRGNAAKAMEYYQMGLKLAEESGNKAEAGDFNGNIGYIYSQQGEMKKNFEYTQKALKLYEEVKNETGIATALLNLGYYYEHEGDLEKGLEYILKSQSLQEKLGNKSGVAYALANSGRIYQKQGKNDKALEVYEKSLKIREELKDKKGIVYSLHKIGGLYLSLEKTREALDYGNRAFSMAGETGYPDLIKRTSSLLYDIYKKQRNFEKALEMHELFIRMRDSISNEEIGKATLQKQLEFDFEKKEAAIKAEKNLAEADSKKQKIIIGSVFLFLIVVIVAGLNTFRSLRLTRKQKAIIEAKNKETEEQKKLIEEKNKDIMDSIRYAKRIQNSQLPSEKYIERVIRNKG